MGPEAKEEDLQKFSKGSSPFIIPCWAVRESDRERSEMVMTVEYDDDG
jgi:hypothetical protein